MVLIILFSINCNTRIDPQNYPKHSIVRNMKLISNIIEKLFMPFNDDGIIII